MNVVCNFPPASDYRRTVLRGFIPKFSSGSKDAQLIVLWKSVMSSSISCPQPNLNAALEHTLWISKRQAHGFFVLKAMSNRSKEGSNTEDAIYLQNTSKRLIDDVREILLEWTRHKWHVFYAVNSFSKPRALKCYAVPGRLAYVDADNVALPPPGPVPTRIVRTSPGNHQFLYELDELPQSKDLEAISRYLTLLVQGDRGGHHLAKLLRMPGTINWKPKYDPNPLVTLVPHDTI